MDHPLGTAATRPTDNDDELTALLHRALTFRHRCLVVVLLSQDNPTDSARPLSSFEEEDHHGSPLSSSSATALIARRRGRLVQQVASLRSDVLVCSQRRRVVLPPPQQEQEDNLLPEPSRYTIAEWLFGDNNQAAAATAADSSNNKKKSSSSCLGKTYDACVFFDAHVASGAALWSALETVRGGGILCLPIGHYLEKQQQPQQQQDGNQVSTSISDIAVPGILGGFHGLSSDCLIFVDERFQPVSVTMPTSPPPLLPPPKELAKDSVLASASSGSEPHAAAAAAAILDLCCNSDQRDTLTRLINAATDALTNSNVQSVVSLGGRRGRGKSFMAGLLAAWCLRHRDVLIMAPNAQNVQGLLAACCRGLDADADMRHYHCFSDADGQIRRIQQLGTSTATATTTPKSLFYVSAEAASGLALGLTAAGAEMPLCFVDETSSVWIPKLQQFLKIPSPFMLMLGTSSGAEGTGAAVQEKLFHAIKADGKSHPFLPHGFSGRTVRELELVSPVRYAAGDPIEQWLESVLFLDTPLPRLDATAYGRLGDAHLCLLAPGLGIDQARQSKFMMELLGLLRGHYRTSPDDIISLLSQTYTRAFVLAANGGCGPPIAAVIAVAEIPERVTTSTSLHKSHLVAFNVERAFPHIKLRKLSGLRPWRVIVAPAARGRGFGKRAMKLIDEYLQRAPAPSSKGLGTELYPGVHDVMNALPERHWDFLGVSFGATRQLYRFWSKAGYRPVYMSPVVNPTTGERSIVMIKHVHTKDMVGAPESIFHSIPAEFSRSFFYQLPSIFRSLPASLCVDILLDARAKERQRWWVPSDLESSRLLQLASSRKPLEAAQNSTDLLPMLAQEYFLGVMGDSVELSRADGELLVALGGQRRLLDDTFSEQSATSQYDINNTLHHYAQRIAKISMEYMLYTGTMLDVECLLTVAPRNDILMNRSRVSNLTQAWTPPLRQIWPGVRLGLDLDRRTESKYEKATVPNTHPVLSVREPYFSMFLDGSKTVEGRLAVAKFTQISPGAAVVLQRSGSDEGRVFLVVRKMIYRSFEEMLSFEPMDHVLPNASSLSDGINIYRQFYSEEAEKTAGGVVALELQMQPEDSPAPALSVRAQVVSEPYRNQQSLLVVDAQWIYTQKSKMRTAHLQLKPRWDLFCVTGASRNNWCVEAALFRTVCHRAFTLPSSDPEEFLIKRESGPHSSKPRWGEARVLLTVWDAAILQLAPDSFLGQAWLPELGTSIYKSGKALCLPLSSAFLSAPQEIISLSLGASWDYNREESSGLLTLKKLRLVGDSRVNTYVDVKIFQQMSRAVEDQDGQLIVPINSVHCRRSLDWGPQPPLGSFLAKTKSKRKKSGLTLLSSKKHRVNVAFALPENLLKLGRRLRFAGFDAAITSTNAEAKARAHQEGRKLILSRGRPAPKGACVVAPVTPEHSVDDQLREVLGKQGILVDLGQVASRCVACNCTRLALVSKSDVALEVPANTLHHHDEFWKCAGCDKIYWEGSVWDKSLGKLKDVLA